MSAGASIQHECMLLDAARHIRLTIALPHSIFSVPWSTLTNALETLADSHHTLASRIEADVERPLRDFAHSNREMQAMATIQGNLASMARDIEGAQKKNERLASKGAKAKTTNVANASNDLETAQGQWESQAPYVFETLQAVDDARLNQLRDVLTQFQTQQIDQVEKDRTAAEQGLNVLLTVETADEIKTFALRTTQGQTRNSASLHAQPPRSRHSVIGPSIPSLHAPSTPQLGDDAASQRSGSGKWSAAPLLPPFPPQRLFFFFFFFVQRTDFCAQLRPSRKRRVRVSRG